MKEEKPDALLVACGHHATFVPYELLRTGFEVVAPGEGDQTITDLAAASLDGGLFEDIPGVILNSKEGGNSCMMQTAPGALAPEVDKLPLPLLHLVSKECCGIKPFGNGSVDCLETSREGPYARDFCSVTPTWGHKWRNKPNKRILIELGLAKRLGYDWIFCADEIFVVCPNVDQRWRCRS